MQTHQPPTFLPWSPMSLTFHRGSASSNFAIFCARAKRGQARPTRPTGHRQQSWRMHVPCMLPARLSAPRHAPARANRKARNATLRREIFALMSARSEKNGARAPWNCAHLPGLALFAATCARATLPSPAPYAGFSARN